MENIFKGHANDGGVYRILNKKNGRVYYGSAARFKQRSREHLSALRKGTHHNKFLQKDFNKCGEDVFQFEVIKVVDLPPSGDRKEWSLIRVTEEQKFINEAFDNRNMCYNGTKYAVDIGYHPWEENRKEKMSEVMTKIYSNPFLREKSKQYSHKRWKMHFENRNNITVTNKNTGETVSIIGSIKNFCKERGLSYTAFHLMVTGKTKSSAGWFLGTKEPKYISQKGQKRKPLSEEHRAKISGGKYQGIVLRHLKTDETFTIGLNAKEDCRQRSISYSSFQKMMKGKCASTSGWIV